MISILVFIFLIVIAVILSLKLIALSFIKHELNKLFPESKITLSGFVFKPTHLIGFSLVEIKKDHAHDLKIKDLKIEYNLGALFTTKNIKIHTAEFDCELPAVGFKIIKAAVNLDYGAQGLELLIDQIVFNKIGVNELKGRFKLRGNTLSSDYLSAKIWDGEVNADVLANIGPASEYTVNLKLMNLDIDRFVNDFNLEERFQMSGKVSGPLTLGGRAANLNILSGELVATGGGRLVIKDDRFLKNMAQKTQQSLDLIVESFKDYQYNNGVMKLSLDQGKIILDVALEGETGKRNLNIILHDFKLI